LSSETGNYVLPSERSSQTFFLLGARVHITVFCHQAITAGRQDTVDGSMWVLLLLAIDDHAYIRSTFMLT
jgi:hypothetical protein